MELIYLAIAVALVHEGVACFTSRKRSRKVYTTIIIGTLAFVVGSGFWYYSSIAGYKLAKTIKVDSHIEDNLFHQDSATLLQQLDKNLVKLSSLSKIAFINGTPLENIHFESNGTPIYTPSLEDIGNREKLLRLTAISNTQAVTLEEQARYSNEMFWGFLLSFLASLGSGSISGYLRSKGQGARS